MTVEDYKFPEREGPDAFVTACFGAARIAARRGYCKITMFGRQVGVVWIGPDNQIRSWFEPIEGPVECHGH